MGAPLQVPNSSNPMASEGSIGMALVIRYTNEGTNTKLAARAETTRRVDLNGSRIWGSVRQSPMLNMVANTNANTEIRAASSRELDTVIVLSPPIFSSGTLLRTFC